MGNNCCCRIPETSELELPLMVAPAEELISYEAACRSNPKLRTFVTTLQWRTRRAISTLAMGAEERSLSLNSLHAIRTCLIDTNRDVVDTIFDFKKDIQKSPELIDLVKDYFETSLCTLDMIAAFDKCLKRARDSKQPLLVALQRFDDEEDADAAAAGPSARYARTLQELRQFKAAGDPFTDEFFAAFQAADRQQRTMWNKLQLQQRLLGKKVKTIEAWRRVSRIIFATTFAAVLICSVVAAAIAAPPVAAALAAVAAAPLAPAGQWIDSMMEGYQDALCGHKEVVSAMQLQQTVTFNIDIQDLDNIRDLIDQVEVDISSMIDRIEFTERGEDLVKIGVEEIKKKLENFMKSVEDLEEKAGRCSLDIHRASTLVLRRFIEHPI